MQEELTIIEKKYKNIKPLFRKKILKNINVSETLEAIQFIKEHIMLIPIVDKNVKLDKLVKEIGNLKMKLENLSVVKSIYIHIPFCSSLCTYCDFSKMYSLKKYSSKYLESLSNELNERYSNEEIETIYIGGGTPSVLDIDELKKLFEITNRIHLKNDYEFTIECNINDITEEKIKIFKKNKVNRISIGVQTFNKETLKKMNRKHSYDIVKKKIALLKKYDINNINVDLIYAFPGTNIDDLKKDLDLIFSLDIKHISTYSLMIEPHTLLYINNVKNIEEELDCEMYELICKEMKKHGFKHYEVSNFCLDGFESKHNLTYWNNQEYYGFGLGASGYIDNLRYTNTLSMV